MSSSSSAAVHTCSDSCYILQAEPGSRRTEHLVHVRQLAETKNKQLEEEQKEKKPEHVLVVLLNEGDDPCTYILDKSKIPDFEWFKEQASLESYKRESNEVEDEVLLSMIYENGIEHSELNHPYDMSSYNIVYFATLMTWS